MERKERDWMGWEGKGKERFKGGGWVFKRSGWDRSGLDRTGAERKG